MEPNFSFLHNLAQNCSRFNGWANNYTVTQNKKLLLDPATNSSNKYLVVIPKKTGISDRICSLVTLFLVSVLTDRIFQIGNRNHHITFEDYFYSHRGLNWTRDIQPHWPMLKFLSDLRGHKLGNTSDPYVINFIDTHKGEALKFLQVERLDTKFGGNATNTFVFSNRGRTLALFQNKNYAARLSNMGLTPQNAFSCVLNYLIKPVEATFDSTLTNKEEYKIITSTSQSLLKIVIQIRTGDETIAHPDRHVNVTWYNSFFDCAKQIEAFALKKNSSSRSIWYLLTDSIHLRREAIKKYGKNKVITFPNQVIQHSANTTDKTGVRRAIAEWYLMGFAHFHVISESSGFGKTGAMRSGSPFVYIVPDKPKAPMICNEKSFATLDEMAISWSGI